MSACEDCWGEAYLRSRTRGGLQVEHYYELLALPADQRPWCANSQTAATAPVDVEADAADQAGTGLVTAVHHPGPPPAAVLDALRAVDG